ncbi:hypothetical protein E2C01_010980 [Portunus trituberculatus]|uniref:Uncharacterized protein n=1 Tax=Portunus trituberculatus TaxID=210409 RepID=A0A5B7DAB6_PORTR|nr:hypothetical protein [Portunus trituberculatus]
MEEKDEEDKVSFKEIIQEQLKEEEENIAKKVVGVLKQKELLVREITKKSVLIFSLKENKVTYRPKREKEFISVKDLFKNLNDEERQNLEEVSKIHRMGPYRGSY